MYFQYGQEETEYLSGKDEKLGAVIAQVGRVNREVDTDLFSAVVHHIVGQQISTKAQATIWQRMRGALGTVDAEHILEAGNEQLQLLGISCRKAEYITDFARKIQNGEFDLEGIWQKPDEEVIRELSALKGMRYNPFHYIRSEKDILKLVNTIIANTKGDGEKSGEDFWVKAERLLYCALIGYIWYEAPEEEQNFSTLLEFINASEAREDDEEFKNPVDELFEELEQKKPEHFAVRQYKKYKLAAGDICSK